MEALIVLAAALLMAQSAPPAAAGLGPTLPAGSNAAFHSLCLAVEEKMEAGDFGAARRLFGQLPRSSFTLGWDEAGLPASLRSSFAAARDRAVQSWMKSYPGAEISVVSYKKGMKPPPALVVAFTPSIPAKEGDALPPGVAHFFSEDPAEPRLECVISLKRGNPSVPADFIDVHNEIAYAITQYSGVERSPLFGAFSSRTDVSATKLTTPQTLDRLQVQSNLDACSLLAKALMKGERITPARPKIVFDPPAFEGGNVNQGEVLRFKIQITNVGNAPLMIRAMPDCSCVAAARTGPIEPGETRLLQAQIDLHEVVGDFDKNILLYSNDVEKTVTFIPLRLRSEPLYRFLPENDGFVLMQKGGVKTKVFLALSKAASMKPTAARLDGVDAKVTFRPWSGSLADPRLDEPAKPREGYVFEIDIKDELAPGRTTGTLWIQTSDPKYREIYHNLFIQRGIVALPDQIRLGEIPSGPRRAAFLVSRPHRPFKIVRIESDSPFITGSAVAVRNDWEYRVSVQYDGKAAPGLFSANIKVFTDDREQPVLAIPFHAMIQ